MWIIGMTSAGKIHFRRGRMRATGSILGATGKRRVHTANGSGWSIRIGGQRCAKRSASDWKSSGGAENRGELECGKKPRRKNLVAGANRAAAGVKQRDVGECGGSNRRRQRRFECGTGRKFGAHLDARGGAARVEDGRNRG